jgi:predicted nucleotidyltransferase
VDAEDAEVRLSPPPNVILAGINGSTAYGLATEDSDVDRIGCYAAPTSAFHGLHLPVGKGATWVSTKPDATYHEAGKLAALLLKGNPTVTEICWLDAYEVITPEGEALTAIRSSFLSAKAIRNAYLGYAAQQFWRIRDRGDGSFSADTRKRTAKHARHLWRLLHQGCELHRAGSLSVLLPADIAAACRAFGEQVAAGDLDLAATVLARAEEAFDGPGVLPDRPDEAAAEAWLQDVRRAYWDRP